MFKFRTKMIQNNYVRKVQIYLILQFFFSISYKKYLKLTISKYAHYTSLSHSVCIYLSAMVIFEYILSCAKSTKYEFRLCFHLVSLKIFDKRVERVQYTYLTQNSMGSSVFYRKHCWHCNECKTIQMSLGNLLKRNS